MANIKIEYGGSTAIAFQAALQTLASSQHTGEESDAVDNSVNKYLDALVYFHATVANTAPGNDKAIYIFAYGSEDGSNYTDNATGSQAGITKRDPTNLKLVHMLATPTQNVTYKGVFAIATAFGGILPYKWGLVIINYTAMAFTAAGASYRGVYATSV